MLRSCGYSPLTTAREKKTWGTGFTTGGGVMYLCNSEYFLVRILEGELLWGKKKFLRANVLEKKGKEKHSEKGLLRGL